MAELPPVEKTPPVSVSVIVVVSLVMTLPPSNTETCNPAIPPRTAPAFVLAGGVVNESFGPGTVVSSNTSPVLPAPLLSVSPNKLPFESKYQSGLRQGAVDTVE